MADGTGSGAAAVDPRPLFGAYGIVKRFGSFTANDRVDLEIRAGEIHALLGENGAGKSTLMKILYGLLEPTEGVVTHRGEAVRLRNPEAARRLGIGMVFQHFSLCENLTVAENIALVMERGLRRGTLAERIAALGATYGLHLEPDRPVWSLSAGERQRIEIVRCLLQEPKLLILDEPTSVLTPGEAELLFTVLERLRAEGRALLYISHRLEEVRRLCARATILRGGRVVGACDPRAESAASLAALMVGEQVREVRPGPATSGGGERLRLEQLSLPRPGAARHRPARHHPRPARRRDPGHRRHRRQRSGGTVRRPVRGESRRRRPGPCGSTARPPGISGSTPGAGSARPSCRRSATAMPPPPA